MWWVRKGRKYIGRDQRFFGLVLLYSITPLLSTCKAAPDIQREERPRMRYGKCCNIRGGGLEPHKMTAKNNGPLTIYSLYKSSLHIHKSTRRPSPSQPSSQNNLLFIIYRKESLKRNGKTDANQAKKNQKHGKRIFA